MNRLTRLQKILAVLLLAGCLCCRSDSEKTAHEIFADFTVHPTEANVEFFWQDDQSEVLRSIENLKNYVEKKNRRLRFAMNGGMYQEDNKPLGLFVENRKRITPLNTRQAQGNFYLQPNGVFYLTTEKKAFVVPTTDFKNDGNVNFATQSGPMILVDGAINPVFKLDSTNLNVRNGVCVLENGRIYFAISRREVNFYEFAAHFQRAGCRNALYLDGFVSKMYLPEKNLTDTGGNFGVIIGVTAER